MPTQVVVTVFVDHRLEDVVMSNGTSALPLQQKAGLPPVVFEILERACSSWLKNTEVTDLLVNHRQYGLHVSLEPPVRPPGKSSDECSRPVHSERAQGHCRIFTAHCPLRWHVLPVQRSTPAAAEQSHAFRQTLMSPWVGSPCVPLSLAEATGQGRGSRHALVVTSRF